MAIVLNIIGAALFLYSAYHVFSNLSGMLPSAKDRCIRSTWQIANWIVGYVKAVLICTIGLMLLKLI